MKIDECVCFYHFSTLLPNLVGSDEAPTTAKDFLAAVAEWDEKKLFIFLKKLKLKWELYPFISMHSYINKPPASTHTHPQPRRICSREGQSGRHDSQRVNQRHKRDGRHKIKKKAKGDRDGERR
jgi:hypothetical protein